ncbi:MAG TPA: hypothetical protein VHK05_02720 [Candidatus Limnocylindrales bacterium]|jgi:hypothetical protein|nr:hypothetical protein [Candidatus Limnocylindrales bacterium]
MTKKKRGPSGQPIGAIIVGFDQQIFRTLPPAQELVLKSKPVRGLSGQDPMLEVVFPGDIVVESDEPARDRDTDV